jgi:hypothetical protein
MKGTWSLNVRSDNWGIPWKGQGTQHPEIQKLLISAKSGGCVMKPGGHSPALIFDITSLSVVRIRVKRGPYKDHFRPCARTGRYPLLCLFEVGLFTFYISRVVS